LSYDGTLNTGFVGVARGEFNEGKGDRGDIGEHPHYYTVHTVRSQPHKSKTLLNILTLTYLLTY